MWLGTSSEEVCDCEGLVGVVLGCDSHFHLVFLAALSAYRYFMLLQYAFSGKNLTQLTIDIILIVSDLPLRLWLLFPNKIVIKAQRNLALTLLRHWLLRGLRCFLNIFKLLEIIEKCLYVVNVLIADSETILLALAHKHGVRKFKPGIDLLLFGSAELR